MSKGFIMLDKSFLEDPLYLSERFTRSQAFLDLCFNTTFKENYVLVRGNKVTLKQGQLAISLRELAVRWKWSVNTVKRYIDDLQDDGYIDTQKTAVNQIITIKKYVVFNTQIDTKSYTQVDTQADTQNDTLLLKNKDNKENIDIKKEDTKVSEKEKELELKVSELGEKLKQLQSENESKKQSSKFIPPTLEEVKTYVAEKGLHLDAERFFSYYESNGWVVGKSKMKKWKAACATWETKWKEQNPQPSLFNDSVEPENDWEQ